MIFSQSCQYAIKSCIYLAIKQDKTDVVEIAKFINTPIPFTSKILQKLAKKNIICSSKGRFGGFYLDDNQFNSLTIKDIYYSIEGEGILLDCVLGIKKCNNLEPCPIHNLAASIKLQLNHILLQKIKDLKDIGKIEFN